MSNFDEAAVFTIFDKVVSYALTLGRFDAVNQHEPKNAPAEGVICSVWVQTIRPVRSSGLASTSGLVVLQARIYMNFRQEPYDMIDPKVLAATADLIGAFSGDFEFGSAVNVRNIDLLGSNGAALSAQAGFVEIDRQVFRVMTITIPIVVNDMFQQVALWR